MDVDFERKGVYVWDRLPCGLCHKGRSRAASKTGWQGQECGNWILYCERKHIDFRTGRRSLKNCESEKL